MAAAERAHGHISQTGDPDPFLHSIREAVAREAAALGPAYRQGAGVGARYTAFERHARLTRAAVAELESGLRAVASWRSQADPASSSAEQFRRFESVMTALPWSAANRILGQDAPPPEAPPLARYVDRPATGQEELMRAFDELFAAPTSRHVFSFALAAFIDVIVFLLAFAAGPYFHGEPAARLRAAAASIDSADEQIFVRDFLRKLRPGENGLAQVDSASLTPGEQQFCLALAGSGHAAVGNGESGLRYLFDRETHALMMDSLAAPGLPLRALRQKAPA
jgi:hypothetical protein